MRGHLPRVPRPPPRAPRPRRLPFELSFRRAAYREGLGDLGEELLDSRLYGLPGRVGDDDVEAALAEHRCELVGPVERPQGRQVGLREWSLDGLAWLVLRAVPGRLLVRDIAKLVEEERIEGRPRLLLLAGAPPALLVERLLPGATEEARLAAFELRLVAGTAGLSGPTVGETSGTETACGIRHRPDDGRQPSAGPSFVAMSVRSCT